MNPAFGLVVFVCALLNHSATAHLCLITPRQRGDMDISTGGSHTCFRHGGPCGGIPPEFPPPTQLEGGMPIFIKWQQNYNHYTIGYPGFMDIAIAVANEVADNGGGDSPQSDPSDPFMTLAVVADRDEYDQANQRNYTAVVTLPNMDCEHCVIRARYVAHKPGETTFYQCADVKVVRTEIMHQNEKKGTLQLFPEMTSGHSFSELPSPVAPPSEIEPGMPRSENEAAMFTNENEGSVSSYGARIPPSESMMTIRRKNDLISLLTKKVVRTDEPETITGVEESSTVRNFNSSGASDLGVSQLSKALDLTANFLGPVYPVITNTNALVEENQEYTKPQPTQHLRNEYISENDKKILAAISNESTEKKLANYNSIHEAQNEIDYNKLTTEATKNEKQNMIMNNAGGSYLDINDVINSQSGPSPFAGGMSMYGMVNNIDSSGASLVAFSTITGERLEIGQLGFQVDTPYSQSRRKLNPSTFNASHNYVTDGVLTLDTARGVALMPMNGHNNMEDFADTVIEMNTKGGYLQATYNITAGTNQTLPLKSAFSAMVVEIESSYVTFNIEPDQKNVGKFHFIVGRLYAGGSWVMLSRTEETEDTYVNFLWADYDISVKTLYVLLGNENDALGLSARLYKFFVMPGPAPPPTPPIPDSYSYVTLDVSRFPFMAFHLHPWHSNLLLAVSPGLHNTTRPSYHLVAVDVDMGTVTELMQIAPPGIFERCYGGAVVGGFNQVTNQLLHILPVANTQADTIATVDLLKKTAFFSQLTNVRNVHNLYANYQ